MKRCLAESGQESVDVELIMSLFDTDRSGFLEWDEFQDFVCYTSWSNAMLDFIPLAEIERVSYIIRNKSLALQRDESLSPSPSRGPSSPPAGNNAPPVQQNGKFDEYDHDKNSTIFFLPWYNQDAGTLHRA